MTAPERNPPYLYFWMVVIANAVCIMLGMNGDLQHSNAIRAGWVIFIDAAFVVAMLYFELIPRIPIGTKSLLVGAHQFIWHPFTVFLAWVELYGIPNWKECVCIFIHDWGYWGCENMEGEEGQWHPAYAAALAERILGHECWYSFCLLHSRTVAEKVGSQPSRLCWADKLCVKFDPWWIYLPRVFLSGEIWEYRKAAIDAGLVPEGISHRKWYEWARNRMIRKAFEHDVTPPYTSGS